MNANCHCRNPNDMFDSLGYANDKQIFEDKIVLRTPNTKTKNKIMSFMWEAFHINNIDEEFIINAFYLNLPQCTVLWHSYKLLVELYLEHLRNKNAQLERKMVKTKKDFYALII